MIEIKCKWYNFYQQYEKLMGKKAVNEKGLVMRCYSCDGFDRECMEDDNFAYRNILREVEEVRKT